MFGGDFVNRAPVRFTFFSRWRRVSPEGLWVNET